MLRAFLGYDGTLERKTFQDVCLVGDTLSRKMVGTLPSIGRSMYIYKYYTVMMKIQSSLDALTSTWGTHNC